MKTIEELRQAIDEVDKEIVRYFERRQNLVKAIGQLKNKEAMGIRDLKREEEIYEKNISYLEDKDKSDYIKALYEKIIELSIKYQEEDQ